MVAAKQIHHMTLIVNDEEKTRDFFVRILGLREIKKPNPNLSVIWFGMESNELHCMVNPAQVEDGRTDMSLVGQERGFEGRHVAFTVTENLDEVASVLESENIPYHRGTAGLPQIFCEDPSGNFIEINTGWYQAPL